MSRGLWFLAVILPFAACRPSTGDDAGSSDAGSSDAGSSDAGSSDAGSSDAGSSDAGSTDGGADAGTVTDAGTPDSGAPDAGSGDGGSVLHLDGGPIACPDAGACIWVNALTPGRVVPAGLFGDQIPNLSSGSWLWDSPPNATCSGLDGGAPREALLSLVGQLGITLLRYPGGTPGDWFHWQQAVGPMSLRTPQIDPFSSAPGAFSYYCPTFGPDELAAVARRLGTEVLVSTNVGTGTAQEAAAWLRHYADAGVPAKYWEIGNENYIPGYLPDGGPYYFSGAHQSPSNYTATFNAFAAALRGVDPSVKVGAIITDDSSWNSVVVAGAQAPDFYAVHVGYAPLACIADAGVDDAWRSTLSSNVLIRYRLDQIEQQVAQYAPAGTDAGLAMTEHAAWWLPCGSDTATNQRQIGLNHTLAGALYSATLYNLMIADPKLAFANHINVSSPFWQAGVRTDLADGYSNPVVTPFFHVFRLYAQSARGHLLPATVSRSPTYDALVPFGGVPPLAGLPSVDAVAVEAPARDRAWVYVVNRDLHSDATATIAINGLVPSAIDVDVVNGATYDAANSSLTPNAVVVSHSTVTPTNPFTWVFPAHSLTRLTVR